MEELKNFENTNDSPLSRAPHEAIFLVVAYLPVFELIEMSQVCKSLRDAVEKDILPWLNIIIDKPLSRRFSDDYLIKITAKASGLLRSLALVNCPRITDDGLLLAIAGNPQLQKLFVPGCTRLTPSGVIKAVKMIPRLRILKINGIYNVNKDDLQTLDQLIGKNSSTQTKVFNLFQHRHTIMISPTPIDVDICPRCQEIRMVFDCPRESCMNKLQQSPPSQRLQEIARCHRASPTEETQEQCFFKPSCRACYYCIPRCEECGVCINDEVGEAACQDILCLDCWLKLPKCNFCNKAYCRNHVDQKIDYPDSSEGFLCATCNEEHLDDHTCQDSLATEDE